MGLLMSNLADIRELIQDDIISCIDGYTECWRSFGKFAVLGLHPDDANDLRTNLCQIVVDRFKEVET